jgi:hypothetical protein
LKFVCTEKGGEHCGERLVMSAGAGRQSPS